jgi:hypothetical protein
VNGVSLTWGNAGALGLDDSARGTLSPHVLLDNIAIQYPHVAIERVPTSMWFGLWVYT